MKKTRVLPLMDLMFGRKTDYKANRFNNYCEGTQLTRSDVALLSRLWLGAGLKDQEDPPRKVWVMTLVCRNEPSWVRHSCKFKKAFQDPEVGECLLKCGAPGAFLASP